MSNTDRKIQYAWAASQNTERHKLNEIDWEVLWQRSEWNLLGTLLMARSGRRTRTVLIADRLTLCPSSEYSSILQGKKSHCCVTGIVISPTLANPEYLWGIQLNTAHHLWDTETLTTNHWGLAPSGPNDAIVILQRCNSHPHPHTHLTFNWH